MESFIHADIFFVITSATVIVVGALLVVLLVHLVHIVRDTERFVSRVREEGEEILDDARALRTSLKKGVQRSRVASFFSGMKKKKSV